MAIPEDDANVKGEASGCIISEDGQIHGKIFGNDQFRGRDSFKIACTKASQVWITGYPTIEYERLVFSDQIDPKTFGISMPDLIGWRGGLPVSLREGTKLTV